MSHPVKSYDQIIKNVRQFNNDLGKREKIITQLSQFRHWYYIPELKCFGASKFIGYKDMNTFRYNRGKHKDGRETEAVLGKYFKKVKNNKLFAQLETLLHQYGKKPNKKTQLHVPKERRGKCLQVLPSLPNSWMLFHGDDFKHVLPDTPV